MLNNPTIVLEIARSGSIYWKARPHLHNRYGPAIIASNHTVTYYWIHGVYYHTYLEFIVALEQLKKYKLTLK